jgi:transposase
VIADGLGRAGAFILAPGQAHELPHAVPLLDRLPGVPQWVVADRGLSRHAFREHIWNLGARPAIPSKQNEAPVACPDWIDANRNHVERLWARLKEWRAIATRYEPGFPRWPRQALTTDANLMSVQPLLARDCSEINQPVVRGWRWRLSTRVDQASW